MNKAGLFLKLKQTIFGSGQVGGGSPPFWKEKKINLTGTTNKFETKPRTLDKSVYQKNIFLISQPKDMLWVLKRTV